MVKLKVISVNADKYSLLDIKDLNNYEINIAFYGLEKKPEIDDIIVFHKELLDESYVEYSKSYQFGALDEVYGREIKSGNDADLIGLIIDGKKIHLKRFFG